MPLCSKIKILNFNASWNASVTFSALRREMPKRASKIQKCFASYLGKVHSRQKATELKSQELIQCVDVCPLKQTTKKLKTSRVRVTIVTNFPSPPLFVVRNNMWPHAQEHKPFGVGTQEVWEQQLFHYHRKSRVRGSEGSASDQSPLN